MPTPRTVQRVPGVAKRELAARNYARVPCVRQERSTVACLVLRWQPTRLSRGGTLMAAGYGARLLPICLLALAACTATAPAGSSAPAKPAAAAPTAAPVASADTPASSAPAPAAVAQRT